MSSDGLYFKRLKQQIILNLFSVIFIKVENQNRKLQVQQLLF